jgi:hypothetical protein
MVKGVPSRQAVPMTAPLVLLIDPRLTFRDAFKESARDSLRVLAFPDIPGALAAVDRHHPTAVLASMDQASEATDGAHLCIAIRPTLPEGLFIAYGPDRDGRPLSDSAARELASECRLDDLLVDDVSAEQLVSVVNRNLGVEAEQTSRGGTGFLRKLGLVHHHRSAGA